MFGEFRDRSSAGRWLAERLAAVLREPDDRRGALVLALPRGGVPVAYEIARRFGARLDVLVVRKLGAPGNEELALGAIASGGMRALNLDVIDALRISPDALARIETREREELSRRERAFRGDVPFPCLRGAVVILVDDGIATGATMRAAALAVRAASPGRLIVAAPVASGAALAELRAVAEDVVCVLEPDHLYAIGGWYADFRQVADHEVTALLAAAALERSDAAHTRQPELGANAG